MKSSRTGQRSTFDPVEEHPFYANFSRGPKRSLTKAEYFFLPVELNDVRMGGLGRETTGPTLHAKGELQRGLVIGSRRVRRMQKTQRWGRTKSLGPSR